MTARLFDGDDLSRLLALDQAARAAYVSRRTIDRWVAAGRLRRLPFGYVIERELLDVETERRRSRRRGRPGARPGGKP